jgi:hypothetical protein
MSSFLAIKLDTICLTPGLYRAVEDVLPTSKV